MKNEKNNILLQNDIEFNSISDLEENDNSSTTIELFRPRQYQLDFVNAFPKYKKMVVVWPRRSGKDVVAFNIIIKAALINKGTYAYCLPTFTQAKQTVWNSITNDGKNFIDFIDKKIIKQKNSSELSIELINGSKIILIGSNNYKRSIVGSNVKGFVFSEYALSDELAYKQGALPIIEANNGFVIFVSTPYGKNHFHELFTIAQNNPTEWFSQLLSINDTKHISSNKIQELIAKGEISQELAMQEFYCSFDFGTEHSYYALYLNKMRQEERLNDNILLNPSFKVHTAWDLGLNDLNVIIFFQYINNVVYIFDYYQNSSKPFEHYIQVVKNKNYIYGTHIAPHDIKHREYMTGNISRISKAKQLGIDFSIAPKLPILDGIEAVRNTLQTCRINTKTCINLVKALEFYHKEYNTKKAIHSSSPAHDWSSNACDALRYLATSLRFCEGVKKPKEYYDMLFKKLVA